MALGEHISHFMVRNYLGRKTGRVAVLVRDISLNKWSRKKPVRTPFPESANGKFGLDLTSDWDYIRPWGGVDQPFDLSHFRGYEHDQDVAGPVIWILSGDPTLSGTLIPHLHGGYLTGAVGFNMNIAHENVRLIPSDLGIENYYFGLRLTLPGGGYRYKTIGSALANLQTIGINVTLSGYEDMDPGFIDCPYALGEFQWDAFICSEIKSSWTSVAPANIIYLPTGTYGSKSVINHGTFTISDWLIAGDTSMSWTWGQHGIAQSIEAVIYTSLSTPWQIKSITDWLTYKVYDEEGTLDITGSPNTWASGSILKLYPTNIQDYGAAARSGSVIIGNASTNMEDIQVSQEEAPDLYAAAVSKWPEDTSSLAWSSVSADIIEGTSTVRVTMNKTAGPTTIYYKIYYHGVLVNTGSLTGWNNGSSTKNLNASSAASDSSVPITVKLSGDPLL